MISLKCFSIRKSLVISKGFVDSISVFFLFTSTAYFGTNGLKRLELFYGEISRYIITGISYPRGRVLSIYGYLLDNTSFVRCLTWDLVHVR